MHFKLSGIFAFLYAEVENCIHIKFIDSILLLELSAYAKGKKIFKISFT